MNITTDELFLMIGMKEAENLKLKAEVNRLQAELNGWQAEARRLQALLDDNIRNNGLAPPPDRVGVKGPDDWP